MSLLLHSDFKRKWTQYTWSVFEKQEGSGVHVLIMVLELLASMCALFLFTPHSKFMGVAGELEAFLSNQEGNYHLVKTLMSLANVTVRHHDQCKNPSMPCSLLFITDRPASDKNNASKAMLHTTSTSLEHWNSSVLVICLCKCCVWHFLFAYVYFICCCYFHTRKTIWMTPRLGTIIWINKHIYILVVLNSDMSLRSTESFCYNFKGKCFWSYRYINYETTIRTFNFLFFFNEHISLLS